MRDTPINTQRETSADLQRADRQTDRNELTNQLYRAYLSGDGEAVERIMAQLEKAPSAR